MWPDVKGMRRAAGACVVCLDVAPAAIPSQALEIRLPNAGLWCCVSACVCTCLRRASFVICDHFGFRAAKVRCLIITLIYFQLVHKELCKSHRHIVPAPQMGNYVDPSDLISWAGT